MTASTNSPRLEIAFDVGHSSIGWAVISAPEVASPSVLGCGTVIFEKDSALANTRRLHRSQRRHVRATRQRIARMEKLLIHLGIFATDELAAKHRANGGGATPWLLAASVLASKGAQTLSWNELWDVLRWYAHNRGYEEITGEVRDDEADADDKKDDTEKVENAKVALAQFGKSTMAETICAWLGQDPLAPRAGTTENYKAKNCAFERALVVSEVTHLLAAHRGKLPGVDEALIAALLLDARAISVPSIRLPRRYQGSLLFGRLATRYHNRIIGRCPISGEKIPSKNCVEFLRYRWAMQLANLRIATSPDAPLRALTLDERHVIHTEMIKLGALTPGALKKLVASLPGHVRDNLEQFFLHPDAKEGLILDPVQKLFAGDSRLLAVRPHLPERVLIRARGRWRRGKSTTPAKLREEAMQLGHDCAGFDAAVDVLCTPPKKTSKKAPPRTRDELLTESIDARRDLVKLSGRAPYARHLLAKAFEEVMIGKDPKASGGCLEETPEVRHRREARPLPQQTNNHLVRHRLQILGRLLTDLSRDPAYADGDVNRITRITLEVNRDLREMAGLSAQDIAKELGQRLKQHGDAVAWLEQDPQVAPKVSAGLIRKARVALDLGQRCPYTGEVFNPIDLVTKRVDLDHIIPRSQRASDSLDSLALTFSAVNKWKAKRTAWQFIQDEGGKAVPDDPRLSIMTPARFKTHIESLNTKGHLDDYRRKKRRKEFFLLPSYEEKARTFTPGQLTQTSQLARLGAQVVRQVLPHLEPHDLVALPGSVTGTVRKSWDVLGCLATAAPGILETIKLPDGTEKQDVRTKTEIRDITHLHHALDACVLALAAHFIPNRGDVWRLLAERRLNASQQAELASLGLFDFDESGHFRLRDLAPALKDQIRHRLAERRVVQHVPADMSGIRVEENTRGVVKQLNGRVSLRQRKQNVDGKVVINFTDELESNVIGLPGADGNSGKLAAIGGVRVIAANYGVAVLDYPSLDETAQFSVIPFSSVWKKLKALRIQNAGKPLRIIRNGMLIRVTGLKGKMATKNGVWRVFSVKQSLKLDLGAVDRVRMEDKGMGIWREVSLTTLGAKGIIILKNRLTGA